MSFEQRGSQEAAALSAIKAAVPPALQKPRQVSAAKQSSVALTGQDFPDVPATWLDFFSFTP